jgi:hypothetical protein
MDYTDENGYLVLPEAVFKRDGPFDEFKQDAAIISVELDDGTVFSRILILYPNYIIGMRGQQTLPFDPRRVVKAFQTDDDHKTRTSADDWTFWKHPWSRD